MGPGGKGEAETGLEYARDPDDGTRLKSLAEGISVVLNHMFYMFLSAVLKLSRQNVFT